MSATNGNGKTLRAVGYCRTSGEGQRDNASIPEQKASVERYTAASGWRLVRHYDKDECKSGAKIAGRDDFQRMMRDAAAGGFDVVVVHDLTRFGRDGMDILESARTLAREYGVHVVDTKGQFDTRGAGRTLTNYVTAGLAEDERLRILERTKRGKISWARRTGAPVTPRKLPFGRTWVQTGRKFSDGHWELLPDKVALVRDVAARYLAGESLRLLAEEYAVNHSHLCKILRERCGPVWTQRVLCKELGLDETIEIAVPPLLPDETIRRLRQRLQGNRCRPGARPSADYLLSGYIFCAACGTALTGQLDHRGHLYYRHGRRCAAAKCPIRPRPHVPCRKAEAEVLGRLFELFGNPAAINRAVRDAVPACDDLRTRQLNLRARLAKVEASQKRLVDAIADGTITRDRARQRSERLAEEEQALRADLGSLDEQLADIPTEAEIARYVQQIDDALLVLDDDGNTYSGGNDVQSWLDLNESAADQRRVVEAAFGGHVMSDAKPAGVYVSGAAGAWTFTIRGRMPFEEVLAAAAKPNGKPRATVSKDTRLTGRTAAPPFVVHGRCA